MNDTQQLAATTLTLRPVGGKTFTSAQAGSLGPYLQGVLMEHIDSGYAGWLHTQPFNPYSQYCLAGPDEGTLVWRINTLTEEAFRQIVLPIQRVREFELHAAGLTLEVESLTMSLLSQKTLADAVDVGREGRMKIEFVTPTAFKRAGEYVFMPDVHSVFQNLLMRYRQVYEGNDEVDEETLKDLEQHTKILSYRLRSSYFGHVASKTRIPGFLGSVALGVRGPQRVCGLAAMLVQFGEYAGVGIKTSMGMGGMKRG